MRYAITPLPDAPRPLPAFLQRFLRDTIRLPDSEIEKITREQTQDLLNRHYAKELQDH
ncbi:MAG: hypothetical protein Q7O66_10465 [Dehalococcoidia bacterium]|nr:hypothetical protein [Dehalococcoidia bacterium]